MWSYHQVFSLCGVFIPLFLDVVFPNIVSNNQPVFTVCIKSTGFDGSPYMFDPWNCSPYRPLLVASAWAVLIVLDFTDERWMMWEPQRGNNWLHSGLSGEGGGRSTLQQGDASRLWLLSLPFPFEEAPLVCQKWWPFKKMTLGLLAELIYLVKTRSDQVHHGYKHAFQHFSSSFPCVCLGVNFSPSD